MKPIGSSLLLLCILLKCNSNDRYHFDATLSLGLSNNLAAASFALLSQITYSLLLSHSTSCKVGCSSSLQGTYVLRSLTRLVLEAHLRSCLMRISFCRSRCTGSSSLSVGLRLLRPRMMQVLRTHATLLPHFLASRWPSYYVDHCIVHQPDGFKCTDV
jgi:hypothetical protein